MGNKWGKCTKRKCAIPLCVSGIAHGYNEIYLSNGETAGSYGCYSASCIFDGLVDGFTEIPVLFCRPFAADIAAVFVIVGLGYAAMLQEPFRPSLPRHAA